MSATCIRPERPLPGQPLGISTTALSHVIGRLEASLGVRLFNRTTRSVALTDAGREFVARVAPALTEIRAAMETVRSWRETPSGMLRINVSVQAGRVVAHWCCHFCATIPRCRLTL